MKKRKRLREKGMVRLSKLFQELKEGDRVMLVSVPGQTKIPKHFIGLTGTVIGKSGKAYIVKFLNGKVVKKLTVSPIHLKKLK
ncbi:50S ribosomal protein L21e [Candidatus Pacearchaeota archaeon ex4484_31]|nr:MAG: 50S ribosomal protein L21e [Candidatus Pacearchaeota archaeon ex4484_31]